MWRFRRRCLSPKTDETHDSEASYGQGLGDHAEHTGVILGLDATLRLVQAEVFLPMRDPGRMQRSVDEIRRRYVGREEMLVEYPAGQQSTLREALERLTHRKWRG